MVFLITAGDISASFKLFRKFRGGGKTPKEVYRFAQSVILTKSLTGPTGYALSVISTEMLKDIIYSGIENVVEIQNN